MKSKTKYREHCLSKQDLILVGLWKVFKLNCALSKKNEVSLQRANHKPRTNLKTSLNEFLNFHFWIFHFQSPQIQYSEGNFNLVCNDSPAISAFADHLRRYRATILKKIGASEQPFLNKWLPFVSIKMLSRPFISILSLLICAFFQIPSVLYDFRASYIQQFVYKLVI